MTSNTNRHRGRWRGSALPLSDGLGGAGSVLSPAAEISGVGSTGDPPCLGSSTQPRVARHDAHTNHSGDVIHVASHARAAIAAWWLVHESGPPRTMFRDAYAIYPLASGLHAVHG